MRIAAPAAGLRAWVACVLGCLQRVVSCFGVEPPPEYTAAGRAVRFQYGASIPKTMDGIPELTSAVETPHHH